MTQITFEQPEDPNRARKFDWQGISEQLKARPGEWGIVAENYYASITHAIKNGKLKAFRPIGAWEATARQLDTKTGKAGKIFVRYVG